MRVFLANDTSRKAHAGCQAVMRSLHAALAAVPGLTLTGRHYSSTLDLDEAAWDQADALFINGEGTLHHSTPGALFLMQLILEAKAAGKKVLLVNALFQQYEAPEPDFLADLALLTVREPRSAAFARHFGGTPQLLLDSAADPKFLKTGKPLPLTHRTLIGGAHGDGLLNEPFRGIQGQTLTLDQNSFEDIVATLAQADLYLTAQHHGLYAAALAACPFVCTPSNSHKIESFIGWTGLPIPIVMKRHELGAAMDFARRNRSIYLELQDFLRGQSVLTAPMIAAALA